MKEVRPFLQSVIHRVNGLRRPGHVQTTPSAIDTANPQAQQQQNLQQIREQRSYEWRSRELWTYRVTPLKEQKQKYPLTYQLWEELVKPLEEQHWEAWKSGDYHTANDLVSTIQHRNFMFDGVTLGDNVLLGGWLRDRIKSSERDYRETVDAIGDLKADEPYSPAVAAFYKEEGLPTPNEITLRALEQALPKKSRAHHAVSRYTRGDWL